MYGAAIASSEGLASAIGHAAAMGGWLLGTALVGVPSLAIVLPLLGARADATTVLRFVARGAAAAGAVLAGLAPAAALFATTSSPATGAAVAIAGMSLAGLLGLRSFCREFLRALDGEASSTRHAAWLLLGAFVAFELVFAARFGGLLLPILGGGR